MKHLQNSFFHSPAWLFLCVCHGVLFCFLGGCAVAPPTLKMTDLSLSFQENAIISGSTGQSVTFDEMIADLQKAQIVYIGEVHTNPDHHRIQLQILKRLQEIHPTLSVGMEMFDKTYQPLLNSWSEGALEEKSFLEEVHWYANWKFRFSLYRDILGFIQAKKVHLVGLNIPFHVPPKIAVGGIDSLRAEEKQYLPKHINYSDAPHRSYVKRIFESHRIPGREDFEKFYAAQCVWDDGMAEAIAEGMGNNPMVVLVGNGHIIHKFGIPNRAFERTGATFRTVYLTQADGEADRTYADYIWVTPFRTRPRHPF